MFGYLKPVRSELKVREDELYRAVYCGICRALGRTAGQAARLLLRYDACVPALLWLCGRDEIPTEKRACVLHPGITRPIVRDTGELANAARAAVLLAELSALDRSHDDPRLSVRVFLRAYGPAFRNAVPSSVRSEALAARDELVRLEEARSSDIDRMAETAGRITAAVMRLQGGFPEDTEEVLVWTGACIGRWVYLADTLDDEAKDRAAGSYNVILEGEEPPEKRRQMVHDAAQWASIQAAAAIDLLPDGPSKGILTNLVTLGMPERLERIMSERRSHD